MRTKQLIEALENTAQQATTLPLHVRELMMDAATALQSQQGAEIKWLANSAGGYSVKVGKQCVATVQHLPRVNTRLSQYKGYLMLPAKEQFFYAASLNELEPLLRKEVAQWFIDAGTAE